MSPDYEERAKNYGFASQLDVLAAMDRSDTTVLDVRSEEEIAESGTIKGAGIWRRTTCSASACPKLAIDPTQIVQNKDAPVVIYCRSGRRASAARRASRPLPEEGVRARRLRLCRPRALDRPRQRA